MSILFCIWNIHKFHCFIKVFLYNFFNFVKRYSKKFSSVVYHIYFLAFKCVVKSGFKHGGIIRKDHCMDIKFERD